MFPSEEEVILITKKAIKTEIVDDYLHLQCMGYTIFKLSSSGDKKENIPTLEDIIEKSTLTISAPLLQSICTIYRITDEEYIRLIGKTIVAIVREFIINSDFM